SPAKHKQMLIDDMMQWDHEERRAAAAKCLSFYYPESLSEHVLALLRKDFVDDSATSNFVQNVLLKAKTIDEARKRLDAFTKDHGELARFDVSMQLFNNLPYGNRKKDDAVNAEALLTALFHVKAPIDRYERPKNPGYWTPFRFSRFLQDGLVYDET